MRASSELSKKAWMVRWQIANRGVRDPAVLAAMGAVPRHEFVPPEYLDLSYADRPLPIGAGQTISQPYIVAYMTEALEPGLRAAPAVDGLTKLPTRVQFEEQLAAQVAGAVHQLRDHGELLKPPGVAETLDWCRALHALGRDTLDLASAAATLGAVVKYREDIERARDQLDRVLAG